MWLGWITETLSNDQQRDLNTLVEVTVVQMSAGGLHDVDDLKVWPGLFAGGTLDVMPAFLLRRLVRVCAVPGAKVLDFCCGKRTIAKAMVQLQPLADIHLADADSLAVRAVASAANVLCKGAPLWVCGSEDENVGDAASALQYYFTKAEESAQDGSSRVLRFQM